MFQFHDWNKFDLNLKKRTCKRNAIQGINRPDHVQMCFQRGFLTKLGHGSDLKSKEDIQISNNNKLKRKEPVSNIPCRKRSWPSIELESVEHVLRALGIDAVRKSKFKQQIRVKKQGVKCSSSET